jgi:2-polyprenyl-6-methoxyphenol hydroxylase-like FAD-dependent oxidoreductase
MTTRPGSAPFGRRALIVGAGIAGLATALRLRRSGWETVIVERAPRLRGGGYMINFAGLGYDAAERLGLLPTLQRLQPAAGTLVYVDAVGRCLAVMPVEVQEQLLGDRTLALLRGDLEATLYDAYNALDGATPIRFGTTIHTLDQDGDGVTVRLDDGSRERVDLLVGADGLHSTVRNLALGAGATAEVELGHVVATYPLERRPRQLQPESTISLGLVGRSMSVYTVRDGRSLAFFAYRTDHSGQDLQAGPHESLKRMFGDLGWVVPEVLAQLHSAESVYFDQVSQIKLDRWSQGRVVLVGDAAWCVSLFAGYGSSLAVGGAGWLGDELDQAEAGDGDIPAALRRWEARLRPLVIERQRKGARAKGLFVAPNAATLRLSRLMYRLMANPVMLGVMRRFLGLRKQA